MLLALVLVVVAGAAGQVDDGPLSPVPKDPEGPAPAPAPASAPDAPSECYSAGSVAGAVVGTFAATLLLLAVAALVYKFYWRGRRGKHLILSKDAEGGADQFAFDNPCFRDGSPLARTPPEKDPNRIDHKAKWTGWPSLGVLAGTKPGDKRRALDDSCLTTGEAPAPARVVALRSRDFTGLGFNVCGNMRDGIFVRDVQHRGPAFESGRVRPGDRIEAVRISFRHMVFEDALTILSYASPYEVQLELGSAAPAPAAATSSVPATAAAGGAGAAAAAAGSLLRPRRAGAGAASAAGTAERIVHPLFRSHSSADLAQISKASLRRVQQMNVIGNIKNSQSQATDETVANEYPTLKLSSSPTHPPKETIRLEKTAPTAVVKPERVKRASIPKEPDASVTSGTGTLNKFQKFGVRVLPDPAPRQTTENKPATIEAEKHQNEQNLIKERVATNPFTDSQGHDTVNSEMSSDVSLHYDERGIDVGPVEMLHSSSQEQKAQQIDRQLQRNATHDEEDGHKENNVKHLLSKGLQNLKEKLHHDKRSSGSPESPQRVKDKKQKPARQHKTSMSSDSEGLDGERSIEGVIKSKVNTREEPEKIERKRQRNPEKENLTESVLLPPGSGIPSEIPEEVQRAAAAARSNRKSLQPTVLAPAAPTLEIRDKHDIPPNTVLARESISDSSSDEGGNDASTDSSGRPPKRSNKRKAPPPPAEDAEHNLSNCSEIASKRETDHQDASSTKENITERDASSQSLGWSKSKNGNLENMQNKVLGENGTVINSLPNLARQRNHPELSGKDITNITIDDGNSNVLCSLTSRKSVDDNGGQVNSFPVDSSSSGTSTMETKTVDYDDSVHVSTVNSDSDSDLERLEGDEEEYDRKKGKKGGTTIELNSSHITIHHSPSSDTMQMATELESDSTRKAASLGDLSRLDSEQPMSILERAVSLDLGDGGTPHSSKKRKAPLPPPGEEYLSAIQDTDDGGHYRKEPRLDNAMDTFQRRRLKKSSDWGTLEEALKQTDTSVIPSKASTTEAARMEVDFPKHKESLLIPDGLESEIPNLADDQKVKLSGLSQKFSAIVRAEAINLSGIEPLESSKSQGDKSDNAEQSGRSSPECDHTVVEQEDTEADPVTATENMPQKKTVLHISPEPTKKSLEMSPSVEKTSVLPSQVTIASSSLLGLRQASSEPTEHEVVLSAAPEQILPAISPRIRTGNVISSTPLPNHERTQVSHISPNSNSSIMDHSYIRDSLQSPLVTSSDAGISNIHVVSSTSQDPSASPEIDSSLLVSSATDHFVTAASFVDSTSAPEEMSDNEDIWENDLQPPELPTSPVPILAQASTSSFTASPSMTYITEIQVVTTTDSDNDQTIGSSNMEVTHNGAPISSSFTQKGIKNKPDTTLQSDSASNMSAGVIKDHESNAFKVDNNLLAQLPRSSVTVTSIRTPETASGQSGGTVTETTNNHVSEKKSKSVRPPVPPRKSDLSSPSASPPSMSSSTIMVEVPKIRLAETASSSLLAGGSVSQISSPAAGKFISFSSLSPRTEGSSTRHGSSFEQWVFLDDSAPGGHQNGFETSITDTENGQHASVMTLSGLAPNRSQTVTHIILDTKQTSGGQVQE